MREGFAESRDFGRTVLWALMLDAPRGLHRIDCPVTLVQGVADWVAAGQTVRYLPLIPGSRFSPLLMAGHAPQSDRPATIARLVEETAARAAGRRRPRAPSPNAGVMAERLFEGEAARLLLLGNAMHADVPIDAPGSGVMGYLLIMMAQDGGMAGARWRGRTVDEGAGEPGSRGRSPHRM